MVSHSQYLDSFHITNTADDLFPVFQGLVHFWYILTFHRQIAQTNRMFMFQYSLPARRTNNGLHNVLVQYPTAFRTFFAEELLNRQVLVGYLLLSYNDNLLRRKRKNRTLNPSKPFLPKTTWERGCCNFTREKSTSYPGRQAKADFQFLLRCFIDDDVTFILMFSMCIILQLVSRK